MGEPELIRRYTNMEEKVKGFSLLEVLISIAFLTVFMITAMQGIIYCIRVSQTAHVRWRESLQKWNEVQELRSQPGAAGQPTIVLPGTKAMSYQEIRSELENSGSWGVLREIRH